MRTLLFSIVLFIAVDALVIQGLTLPALIHLMKPQMVTGDASEKERARPPKVVGSVLVDTALAQAIHEVDGETLPSVGVSRTLSRLGHVLTDETTGEQTRTAYAADRILMDVLQGIAAQEGATRDGLCPECANDDPKTAATRNVESDGDDDDGHGTADMSEGEVKRSFTYDQIHELALETIHAQHDTLLQTHDEGIFFSAALEGALAQLDNGEILLVSNRGVDN